MTRFTTVVLAGLMMLGSMALAQNQPANAPRPDIARTKMKTPHVMKHAPSKKDTVGAHGPVTK